MYKWIVIILLCFSCVQSVYSQEKVELLCDGATRKVYNPMVLTNVFFDLGLRELRPESKPSLDNLVKLLQENPGYRAVIGGHTDSRREDRVSYSLSEVRAKSVVDYLIMKGISADRLEYIGYNETKPYILTKMDCIVIRKKFKVRLKPGTILNEKLINSFSQQELVEYLHQYNRRVDIYFKH